MNREAAKEFLEDDIISVERILSVLIESGKKYRFQVPFETSTTYKVGRVTVISSTQVTYENEFGKEWTLRLRDIISLKEIE